MRAMARNELVDTLGRTEGLATLEIPIDSNNRFGVAQQVGKDPLVVFSRGGPEYLLTGEAYTKAARMCGLPGPYVEKTPVELIVPHLNYWFSRRQEDVRALIDPRERVVIALTRPRFQYFSRLAVLEAVEEAMGGPSELTYDKVMHDLHHTSYAVVGGSKVADIRPGDTFRGGIRIEDSILGERPFTLTAYTYRLVCSNGMISVADVYKWSWHHDIDGVVPWVREVARQAYEAVEHEFTHLRRLDDVQVEGNVAEVLRSVFTEYGIGRRMRQRITDQVLNEGAETLYDVVNTITATANDAEIPASMVIRLQRAAGDLTRNRALCPECHSLIRQ